MILKEKIKILFIFFFSLSLFSFFFFPCFVQAATITVNPGESIQTKCANVVNPGDTCIVKSGTYSSRVSVSRSGTASAPIVFQAQGDVTLKGFNVYGNYITIKGFTVTADQCTWSETGVGIWVEGDYCTLEDNYAYYSPRSGISVRSTSEGCKILNNRLHRNGMAGAEIYGKNQLVEGNDVWGSIAYHTPTKCSGDADGFRFFGSNHIYRNNYIHDINFNDPENAGHEPHSDAFQTWKDPDMNYNMTFEGNIIDLLQWQGTDSYGKGWELDALYGGIFKNNIIRAHQGVGAWSESDTKDLKFYNNTFVGWATPPCTNNCWPAAITIEIKGSGTEIKNNIFVNWAYKPLDLWVSVTKDYNLFYNTDNSAPDVTKSTHDLITNPLFVNYTNKDFHLQANSPACAGGEGGTYMGAYPCTATASPSPTPSPSPTSSPSPTPTPTPSLPAGKAGDANGDNKVDGVDYVVWLSHYNKSDTGAANGDFNNSGKVDGVDYVVWVNNYETN